MLVNNKKLKDATVDELFHELNQRAEVVAINMWTTEDVNDYLKNNKLEDIKNRFPHGLASFKRLTEKVCDDQYGYMLRHLIKCNDEDFDVIDNAIDRTLNNLTEEEYQDLLTFTEDD